MGPDSRSTFREYFQAQAALERKFPTDALRFAPEYQQELAQVQALQTQAGKELWDIKTATDTAASKVAARMSHPTLSTVKDLRNEIPPPMPAPGQRSSPVETTVYQIRGMLTHIGLEDDGDYHLVIRSRDKASLTMIAEVPDPRFAAGSAFLTQIEDVRKKFTTNYPNETGSHGAKALATAVSMTLTGVGFFDFPHNQTGAAPNGIELHPVVGVVLSR
jgi:hypothetical protein